MALRPQSLGGDDRDAEGAGFYEEDDARPWFLERWFIASAVFIVLIALLLAVVLGAGGKKHADSPGGSGGQTTQPPSALPIPTVAPVGTTWALWYGLALPSLPGNPAQLENDVPSGFSRTPEGALIAASQLPYRSVFGVHWHDVADKYITGPGREAFLTQIGGLGTPEDTTGASQLAGFRFANYSPDQAQIELVNGRATNYKVGTITVVWIDNDWRIVTQPNGAPTSTPMPISSLMGYAPWTGVAQ